MLAGGLGTRLRSVVSEVPKPMAPVDGRPFLAWLMDYWVSQGATRIVLSVGYLGHLIEAHFRNIHEGCPVSYLHEEAPLGTGGAVKQALTGAGFGQYPVVLINGDTWFRSDISALFAKLRDDRHLVMTVKHIEHNDRYGRAVLDGEDRVTGFEKFKEGPGFINVGCYLLNPKKMQAYLAPFQSKFSFEEDVLKPLSATGQIAASLQEGPFLDIGIPADYQKASTVLGS